jgi:hypothetical protein
MKTKIDFITDLLGNKKLLASQKERLFSLVAEDLKGDKEEVKKIWEEINKLKDKEFTEELSSTDSNNTSSVTHMEDLIDENFVISEKEDNSIILKSDDDINSTNSNNPSLPKKYYNPAGLYKFLLEINQDPKLKSICHLIDSSELEKINEYCNSNIYNYDKHYANILESYSKIENDKKIFAPSYIKALIRGYLTGKKFDGSEISGWSGDDIKLHWGSQSIKDWCYENPGVPPNPDIGLSDKLENGGFQFANPIRIKEDYLQSLGDLVIHFKKMFHIREDNSLLNIIKRQNTYCNWDEKIDFRFDKSSFPENIEFFTDIDKLLQSYNEIIKLIIVFKKVDRPIVLLGLTENENSIYFSINCINGIYGKTLSSAKNRLIGQKYEAVIKKLNGLCNIYLQADFGQKIFSKITIWDDEWNIQKERIEKKCDKAFQGGVEHILEFKRR